MNPNRVYSQSEDARKSRAYRDTIEYLPAREKKTRIDLGLDLARRQARPGVPMTRREIAAWCGCTDCAIYMIEQRALKKLRKRAKQLQEALKAA